MEAGIISEVEKNVSQTANLESEKLQELVDILDIDHPEEAESLRQEIAILERLQDQEESDAIIEVFDDSTPSGGSTSYTTTVANTKTTTAKEMREI